ncbi:MAG: MAPEG family protein, partial [Gammaproteobacteria bacterium]
MDIVAIVSALILIEYWVISFLVGVAREKTGVKAPAMQGAPEFERISRVQQNTLEQLIVLLPAMWLFAFYVHAMIAAGLGVLFI